MPLKCIKCGKEYDESSPIWRCNCGGLLNLVFTPRIEPSKIKNRAYSMWRYREVLPVKDDENIVSFQEGFTPLLPVKLENRIVLIKQDHLFPSGSYKDRGASLLISKVKELGIKRVVEDSSGNAGSAVAAYCAKASISCDIYVPADTSPGKLAQIESYGAKLHKISGNREATAAAVMKAAVNTFYASHSWNPYFFHGTKTFAYEICEQLDWKTPDTIILPVGNGTLFLGTYIGFKELRDGGLVFKLPKLIGIQASSCSPLYSGFINGTTDPVKVKSEPTIAEGIAIAEPVRGKQILEAVLDTKGSIIQVNDNEILSAIKKMHKGGYYIEPTSGAAIAGTVKYLQSADTDEIIVSVFTGHGLKNGGKIPNG